MSLGQQSGVGLCPWYSQSKQCARIAVVWRDPGQLVHAGTRGLLGGYDPSGVIGACSPGPSRGVYLGPHGLAGGGCAGCDAPVVREGFDEEEAAARFAVRVGRARCGEFFGPGVGDLDP